MKSNHKLPVLILAILLVGGSITPAAAQYDDLYYNPDTDSESFYSAPSGDNYQDVGYQDNGYDLDDEGYEAYDDYNYHYTSRIRRFHRPYYGFSYFDPIYVDMAYYDPFWSPALTTMLIYDDYWSFRSWNRWNRFNRFNYWNSWNNSGYGFGPSFGSPWRNRWNDPWYGGGFGNTYVVNNFGYGGFGSGFNNNAGYGSYYCPPSWGNGLSYNAGSNISNNYYGARRTGLRPEARPGSLRLGTTGSNRTESTAGESRRLASPRYDNGTSRATDDERESIRRELNDSRDNRSTRPAETDSRTNRYANPSDSDRLRATERNANPRNGSATSPRSYDQERGRATQSPSRSRTASPGWNSNNSRSSNPGPNGSSRSSGGFNNSRSSSPNWNSGSRSSGGFNSGGGSRSSGGSISAPRSSGGSSRGGGRGN
ncbi:MAG: hypothetical protein RLY31_1268 [Bacteroidota bacterium]